MDVKVITHFIKTSAKHQHIYVLVFVLLIIAIGVFFNLKERHFVINTTPAKQTPHDTKQEKLNSLSTTSSYPRMLKIPSIDIESTFESPLGLSADGAVEVPQGFETVGWYKYGPTPGEIGPAVILGHVDTYEGPAVFYALGQLKEGDEIIVEREDDSIVTFAVEYFERVKQTEFPTEKVYGNISYAGIRLITCTGVYNKHEKRYSHNLIVYGKLTSVTKTTNNHN